MIKINFRQVCRVIVQWNRGITALVSHIDEQRTEQRIRDTLDRAV